MSKSITVRKRRRREGKTDYNSRLNLLKSESRIVFRKTNKYIIGQLVKSSQALDYVGLGLTSKELLEYNWPKSMIGSLKSLPASYLTGYLLGKKMLDKNQKQGILDLGMTRNIKKSKVYAFLKGLIDSGLKIKADSKIFPDENRIRGRHMKKSLEFDKIKSAIDKKFV
ncbi:MAG: 50S ribosomal protein L18 [Candidatus Pacearchaeota archaeon]|nr:50S ribosomal protein L18 [Candidatus Pacearchaeota archaeon]